MKIILKAHRAQLSILNTRNIKIMAGALDADLQLQGAESSTDPFPMDVGARALPAKLNSKVWFLCFWNVSYTFVSLRASTIK